MTNRKRLWTIFGPVILAGLLVIGFICLPWSGHHSDLAKREAAVSLSPLVMKNASIKTQALAKNQHTEYVPFFGSSEFRRMDRFHPAVMAARYHHYRPFMFGSRGTQSLPQLFNMVGMAKEMNHGKAVFIISPQWFVKTGVLPVAFKFYNGAYANLIWLNQANPASRYDRYTARRLLQLIGSNGIVGSAARKIAAGEPLSGWDKFQIQSRIHLLGQEDRLFSGIDASHNYENKIKPKIKLLPKQYNYQKLIREAKHDAKAQTTNNRFGIYNKFYASTVKNAKKRLAGSQSHFSYLQSPEYSDFETVLDQFCKTKTNVMFVITPVNEKWEKYTGLSLKMYEQATAKIKYQLQSQGFNHITDFSNMGNRPGFMQDTIHIGWAGWVDFDRKVAPFLDQPQPAPKYHLQSKFLSRKWQQLKPTAKNLAEFDK